MTIFKLAPFDLHPHQVKQMSGGELKAPHTLVTHVADTGITDTITANSTSGERWGREDSEKVREERSRERVIYKPAIESGEGVGISPGEASWG